MSLQLRQHAETAQAREGHSSDYSVSRAAAHTPDVLQETFRVENVEGRVVLDILRHVLTACNLSSFSLVDCCQSLLGRRLEVLPPSATAHLATDKSTSEIPICLEWTWLACWPCIWHALFACNLVSFTMMGYGLSLLPERCLRVLLHDNTPWLAQDTSAECIPDVPYT